MHAEDKCLTPVPPASSGQPLAPHTRRKLFREAGVPLPDGAEDIHSRSDLVDALDLMQVPRPLDGVLAHV